MSGRFYPLTVKTTSIEIDGAAKTVSFDVPEQLKSKFNWLPGQHLSFSFKIDAEEFRRNYSISNSPNSGDPIRITVKRVKDGKISNYINDHIVPGDVVDVMPPFGSFFVEPEERKRRTHYFFAAGSGITPLFSMTHSILIKEPESQVNLVYGNKNNNSILLLEELSSLQEKYPHTFNLLHVLSSPSIWSSFEFWKKGIIDDKCVAGLFEEFPPYAQDAQYYVCGPGNMNQSVEQALKSMDVPKTRIHMESYGGDIAIDDSVQGVDARLELIMANQTHELQINQGETILQAIRRQNLNPPYSCESGVCGACRAELQQGKVHMRARMALEDTEIESGKILTCQSLPLEDKIKIKYD